METTNLPEIIRDNGDIIGNISLAKEIVPVVNKLVDYASMKEKSKNFRAVLWAETERQCSHNENERKKFETYIDRRFNDRKEQFDYFFSCLNKAMDSENNILAQSFLDAILKVSLQPPLEGFTEQSYESAFSRSGGELCLT